MVEMIFYKRTNRKKQRCENCGKQPVRIVIDRIVQNGLSYVSGYNALEEQYCSLSCAKEQHPEGEFILARKNT